jgi:hypothetical protein
VSNPEAPDILRYSAARGRNREAFLLNFGQDFRVFEKLLSFLPQIWTRIGKERDKGGRSHAGLLLFANLVQRHALVGFEHIACYQSYLGWLTFRPGLEALLILGKFIDNPENANLWRERQRDPESYRQTFSGRGLVSRSLPRSAELQQVLARLNDNFVHANPAFTYLHQCVQGGGASPLIEIGFFDQSCDLHEAHLLAFLNLLDIIVFVSDELIENLCGPPRSRQTGGTYVGVAGQRAAKLARNDETAASVLKDLGLWEVAALTGAP